MRGTKGWWRSSEARWAINDHGDFFERFAATIKFCSTTTQGAPFSQRCLLPRLASNAPPRVEICPSPVWCHNGRILRWSMLPPLKNHDRVRRMVPCTYPASSPCDHGIPTLSRYRANVVNGRRLGMPCAFLRRTNVLVTPHHPRRIKIGNEEINPSDIGR
jgi:hypothetical protein